MTADDASQGRKQPEDPGRSEPDSVGDDEARRTPAQARPSPEAHKAADGDPGSDDLKRPPRLSIEVEVDLESQHCFYSGLTQNLSEGGLFVATYQLHPVGTELSVSLSLEGMPPIEARAQVRWIRDPRAATVDHAVGMGLQFVELSEEDRATIQAFMECRIPLLMEGV
jgi:uncharacterized protein (TIGR02266 family)